MMTQGESLVLSHVLLKILNNIGRVLKMINAQEILAKQAGKILMISIVNKLGDYECECLFNSQHEVEQYIAEAKESGYEIESYKLFKLVEL